MPSFAVIGVGPGVRSRLLRPATPRAVHLECDLVEAELGRAIERIEITRLETLLALADRMELPPEVVELLETTKIEAENGLAELQELTEI
ncbi:DUF892 family protein [Natrarchaeobius oligotrophus]|uniref:DUF892 family protein n=1 Tax=Natrarchaeobius chitinivorans TaxID=1679083 RepID=A0A3N6NSW6_NATCH|nr:DUF892 family protein [Natrarchaeobius chitinivorans]